MANKSENSKINGQQRPSKGKLTTQFARDRKPTGNLRRFGYWFRRHKLGGISLCLLVLLILVAVFADFLSPYPPDYLKNRVRVVLPESCEYFPTRECQQESTLARYVPPNRVHIFDDSGLRWPYVCALKARINQVGAILSYREDCSQKYPIRFFVRNPNYEYKLFGLFETNVHLFGATEPKAPLLFGNIASQASLFLLGTDSNTRDLLSRILVGSRVSLGISLAAILLSLLIALPLGGLSGYIGGGIDSFIQRIVEGVLTFPRLALILVLIVSIKGISGRLFGIILLLACFNSVSLARILRGQILAMREADYIEAARAQGAGHGRIILRHILPQTASTVIVSTALAIPNLLVLESFLSYLGKGVPSVIPSWGLLLKDIGDVALLPYHPWLLFPAGAIFLTVLTCTFLGDALRDWFDPFSQNQAR